jgi:SAM-dependent methyltransferase
VLEPHKQAEIDSRTAPADEPKSIHKPFGRPWPPSYFVKWATIWQAFERLGVEPGSTILDVGCGTGWTTLFLAESGFRPTGLDLVPVNLETGRLRAERWSAEVDFVEGDMEEFQLEREFDAALVFDALHHSRRPARVIERIAQHLRPGGWVLFGEPSWLHAVSPRARSTTGELGWTEKGVRAGQLRRECGAVGLGDFRRFFEGTGPYASRIQGFALELVRLVGQNFAVAPQVSVWLAARKP